MSLKLTILCENSVQRVNPASLLGEHGFACHLQTSSGNYLFDTGSGSGLLHNSQLLGIDPGELRGLILSHGHSDHTGGLQQLLKVTGKLPIFAHPDLFLRRYGSNGGQLRSIGIPWQQTELEQLGADFHLAASAQQINPQLMVSGQIPRRDGPTTDPNLILIDSEKQTTPDLLNDDQSLIINTDKGLVILLGCAHAGLLNIIEHAISLTGQRKIHLLLGGTHLKFSSEQQLETTLTQLEDWQIERFGAAHCTGLHQSQRIAERFGERFFFASVGTEIEI